MPSFRALSKRAAALALFVCSAHATAETASTKPGSDAAISEAKSSYERGVEAYKQGRYRDAIESFSTADRLAPRAALAFNMARAYDRLNETGPALGFYREYLRRGAEAGSRAGVERRVRELAAVLAARGLQQLTILSRPSGATVSIDGRSFGSTPLTLELAPGAHRVVLGRSGYTEVTRNIELLRSDPLLVELELRASQPGASVAPASGTPLVASSERSQPAASNPPGGTEATPTTSAQKRSLWPAWVVLGAGGVALAGAGVLEVMRHDAASEAQSPETSQVRYDNRRSAAETYQTGARVLLGVGSALVLGGAIIAFELGRKPAARTSAALGCDLAGCSGAVRVVY